MYTQLVYIYTDCLRFMINATQVLSSSVAKAFDFYGDPETVETRRFVAMFDKFFDCLNGRSPNEYIKRL